MMSDRSWHLSWGKPGLASQPGVRSAAGYSAPFEPATRALSKCRSLFFPIILKSCKIRFFIWNFYEVDILKSKNCKI